MRRQSFVSAEAFQRSAAREEGVQAASPQRSKPADVPGTRFGAILCPVKYGVPPATAGRIEDEMGAAKLGDLVVDGGLDADELVKEMWISG